MERKSQKGTLYLLGGMEISELSPDGSVLRCAPMEAAGAVCAGKNSLFCADAAGAIWRLNRRTLLPEAVFGGGPGICGLCLSGDEKHLYALVSEADSVLMMDSRSGRPLLLNRCGCNPSEMILRENLLVISGGGSGCVHLYDAGSLVCCAEISMPGPVCSASYAGGWIYALCLTPQLDTLLVAVRKGEKRLQSLQGMPGSLLIHGNNLYAATQGLFHVFDLESLCLLRRMPISGRLSRMYAERKCVVAYDPLSESVYALQADFRWKKICAEVNAVCISENECR